MRGSGIIIRTNGPHLTRTLATPMTVTPAITEEFLAQCKPAANAGITVLTHPGDFFMGWGWFERFCSSVGRKYTALKAGLNFEPDVKAYPPRPGTAEPYDIQVGDFFGGVLQLSDDGSAGKIVMRRSSSSGTHVPTMEMQGLAGLKDYLNNKGWLSNADRLKSPENLRIEIKFKGDLKVLPKKK